MVCHLKLSIIRTFGKSPVAILIIGQNQIAIAIVVDFRHGGTLCRQRLVKRRGFQVHKTTSPILQLKQFCVTKMSHQQIGETVVMHVNDGRVALHSTHQNSLNRPAMVGRPWQIRLKRL